MKKKIYIFLIIFLHIKGVYSAFENQWWGAKAIGLGGSFTAIADDYTAPLWNPGGINNSSIPGIYFMYGKPFWGLDDEFKLDNYCVSLFYPHKKYGKFSFTYTHFDVSSLYFENTYILTYGRSLSEYFRKPLIEIKTGINLKIFHRGFILDERSKSDPFFSESSSTAVLSFDTGIIISPYKKNKKKKWGLGFAIFNINNPSIGIKTEDRIERRYDLGFAYYFYIPDFLRNTTIVPTLSISVGEYKDEITAGVEGGFYNKLLNIRAGYNGKGVSAGIGIEYQRINYFYIGFDYSYMFFVYNSVDIPGTHTFSLNVKIPSLIE